MQYRLFNLKRCIYVNIRQSFLHYILGNEKKKKKYPILSEFKTNNQQASRALNARIKFIFEVIRLFTVSKNFELTERNSNVDHYSTRTRKDG